MRERVVVVAAKAPRAGAVKTRLCPPLSPQDAARLAFAFLDDTLRAASSPILGADLILALDGDAGDLGALASLLPTTRGRVVPQTGNSLGERLSHMIGESFDAGYKAACVMGSDAPHLPAAFLLEAFGRVRRGADVVLGPADDGGYYLVALPRPAPALFSNIPWSSPHVLEATRARAAEAGLSASLLPPWYDVDTPADLLRLREDLRRQVAHAPATAKILERL